MSTHYLINPFTVDGDIIDVVLSETGLTNATGSTVIRIPDGVAIASDESDEPADLDQLLTFKYDGLLASFAGYTEIVADACMDDSTIDNASAGVVRSAGFVNHSILPAGVLLTTDAGLASTPTTCVVVWEEFMFQDEDNKADRYQRVYAETQLNLTARISFDAGSTFIAAVNGAVTNIPVPNQGNGFILELTNGSSDRIYLGSWSIVY